MGEVDKKTPVVQGPPMPPPPPPMPPRPMANQPQPEPKDVELEKEMAQEPTSDAPEAVENEANVNNSEESNEEVAEAKSEKDKKEAKAGKKKEPKPEKTPKQKKESLFKRIKNNKRLAIGLVIAFGVIVLGGGITAGVLVNQANNKKLLTPTLSVIQLYNGTILDIEYQAGVTRYEFVITDATGKTNTYTSKESTLEMSHYLNQPGNFSVKARVYGKGSGATSDYCSAISFTNYVQLETPNVFINNLDKILSDGVVQGYKNNTNLADDTISWDSVKNASKYYVRYGVDTTKNVVVYEEVIPQSEGTISFPLSKIYEKGTGRYQISVIAIPAENSNYLKSNYEQIYSVEYYAKQSKVENANYNKETKTLTFALPVANFGSEYDLFISYASETKEHKIYLEQAEVSTSNGVTFVTCSLQQIASGDILSMTIVTLSDGAYSTNSEAAIVNIN